METVLSAKAWHFGHTSRFSMGDEDINHDGFLIFHPDMLPENEV
jgi:hypothetical protein